MYGWMVVNGFMKKEKFEEIYSWLLLSGQKRGIEWLFADNSEMLMYEDRFLNPKFDRKPDFVLFWDKDVRLASRLEQKGYRVFNSSRCIQLCDDKSETYFELAKANIPMPKTIIGPFTYENIGYSTSDFLGLVEQELEYPYVIKECFGSFGWQVYLAEDRERAKQILQNVNGKPILFQEYVKESRGRDIRLQVVGDRVVAGMYRYSDVDFRANITNGGKMKAYYPTREEEELAVRVAKTMKLDFGGVDVLFGKDGLLLCEVNSHAHFKNIYDCTGVNTADYIIDYIIEQVEKDRA